MEREGIKMLVDGGVLQILIRPELTFLRIHRCCADPHQSIIETRLSYKPFPCPAPLVHPRSVSPTSITPPYIFFFSVLTFISSYIDVHRILIDRRTTYNLQPNLDNLSTHVNEITRLNRQSLRGFIPKTYDIVVSSNAQAAKQRFRDIVSISQNSVFFPCHGQLTGPVSPITKSPASTPRTLAARLPRSLGTYLGANDEWKRLRHEGYFTYVVLRYRSLNLASSHRGHPKEQINDIQFSRHTPVIPKPVTYFPSSQFSVPNSQFPTFDHRQILPSLSILINLS
ncbi:hypothetical protein F4781DRAFT_179062 [Annulohypoxylon bovei var. microspora]|nr:hypothetical protein F4781DRAFT_179062 [Annulohypoxylon bovei var. microspora]